MGLFIYKKQTIIFYYFNLYFFIPSTVFFYCLFNGYFKIQNIKNLCSYKLRFGIVLNLFCWVLLICFILYISVRTVDAMSPDNSNVRDSSSPGELNVYNLRSTYTSHCNNTSYAPMTSQGDIGNDYTSNITMSETVQSVLMNIGTGVAVAGGLIGGSTIAAKASGASITAKIGIMAAGGVIGGASIVLANATNTILQNKLYKNRSVVVESTDPALNTIKEVGSSETKPKLIMVESKSIEGVYNVSSFEEGADINTIIALLDANFILHISIAYLPIALMILYLSNTIVEKQLNPQLRWRNILDERFYNFLLKFLSYTAKHNRIWMFIGWLFLVFASLVSLYISYFILDNIEIISEIVQQSKHP